MTFDEHFQLFIIGFTFQVLFLITVDNTYSDCGLTQLREVSACHQHVCHIVRTQIIHNVIKIQQTVCHILQCSEDYSSVYMYKRSSFRMCRRSFIAFQIKPTKSSEQKCQMPSTFILSSSIEWDSKHDIKREIDIFSSHCWDLGTILISFICLMLLFFKLGISHG